MGISPQQYQSLVKRLGSARGGVEPALAATASPSVRQSHVILGIDPSLRCTGYGVVKMEKRALEAVAFGDIKCPAGWAQSRCLLQIAQTLRDVIQKHRPTVCVVEGIFYAQNLQTAIIMGQARGASLVSVAEAGLEVYEIATRRVKQAIVGYGAASKPAVAKMVQRMLHLAEEPGSDAADALALALAHAQDLGRFGLTTPKRV